MIIFEWAALGALILVLLVICARIMRRGVPTLDDNRKHCMENIRAEERRLEEDRKNISASEHVRIMGVAMEDLLRLDGSPEGYSVQAADGGLELRTPEGAWRVELIMREKAVRAGARVLHGRPKWHLSGFGHDEYFQEPGEVMRSLNGHLHGNSAKLEVEPEHIARRLRHLKQEPARAVQR